MIIIKPTGGLANRLRVIFSYRELAIQKSEKLLVLWKPDSSCDGFFEDFFEPIENVLFADNLYEQKEIYYTGCSSFNINFNYSQLKLNINMQKKLKKRLKLMGSDFYAAHLRRTDLIPLLEQKNKPFPKDEDFLHFFSKSNKCFLATDNPDSQNIFKKNLKNKLVIFETIKDTKKIRLTSLETSILDLFTCVYATKFKGTIYSSFSDLIINLRKENIFIN